MEDLHSKPKTPINDANSVYYHIARASTTMEWRDLNNRVHKLYEQRMEEIAPGFPGTVRLAELTEDQKHQLDFDPRLCELNALGTMTQEIVSMRTAAEKVLDPHKR